MAGPSAGRFGGEELGVADRWGVGDALDDDWEEPEWEPGLEDEFGERTGW